MPIDVLIATAELDPLVKVGGLGEATSGLARALTRLGVRVTLVVPDHPVEFDHRHVRTVDVPDWAGGTARVRIGHLSGTGRLLAVSVPGFERPHPYVDPATGVGWPDNDRRFHAFSASVARVAEILGPAVVMLNDWHTAVAAAWTPRERTVLAIHNLAHQGWSDLGWLHVLGERAAAFEHHGLCNPLAGAIRLCRRVVTVSPGYAREVCTPEHGCGLDADLRARGDDLVGIRNGIDPGLWAPGDDIHLPANFSAADLSGKDVCRKELLHATGLTADSGPVIGVVSRMVDQKGIDLVIDLMPFLPTVPASLVIHGTGERRIVDAVDAAARAHETHVAFVHGYEEPFAHLVVAGSDLLFVPSRFEPCGLTQMQAMTCGTIPVVTAVGGLADTVTDIDRSPAGGTGYVASSPTLPALVDALHRSARGWRNHRRRAALQRRAMTTDWSWHEPSLRYLELFEAVAAEASGA